MSSSDLSALRFVLFDLDGVLVDSRAPITGSIAAALRAGGLDPVPEARLVPWIGVALREVFEALLREQGRDPGGADALVEAYRDDYRTRSLEQAALFPGAAEAVHALAGRFTLAVATSKPLEFTRPILERLALEAPFAHVVGPPLRDSHREDKIGTVARALAALGAEPPPAGGPPVAAMVGDRHVDMRAAHAHRMAAVGATWGFGSEAELRAAGAAHLLATPDALRALVGA